MSGELIETSESSRTHDRGKPHQFVKSHERINIGKLLISAFQKKSEKVKFWPVTSSEVGLPSRLPEDQTCVEEAKFGVGCSNGGCKSDDQSRAHYLAAKPPC